jgi:hypothetical protein
LRVSSQRNFILGWIENVFNFIFTIEIIVRLLARMNIAKHFAEPWNSFDFFIVLVRHPPPPPFTHTHKLLSPDLIGRCCSALLQTSLTSPAAATACTVFQQVGYSQFINVDGGSGTDSLRALRALRALRPLRTVSQVGGHAANQLSRATLAEGPGRRWKRVALMGSAARGRFSSQAGGMWPISMTRRLAFDWLQVKSLRTIANSFVDAVPMLMSVVGVLFFYMVRMASYLIVWRAVSKHSQP